jgi:hypothetical protein
MSSLFGILAVIWLLVDKGISSEVVRSVLAERANLPSLAAKSANKVNDFFSTPFWYILTSVCYKLLLNIYNHHIKVILGKKKKKRAFLYAVHALFLDSRKQ